MAIDLRWRSVSFYNDISLFPIVGSINILYVDRAAMLIYIWNGSSYEATEGGSGGSSITVVANYAALPDPTTVTASFYWCSASQGTAWLPGSLGGSYYNSGLYYSNGTTWEYMSSPYQATQVEVDAGVISDKFVTPNTLYNSSKWGTKQNAITLTTTGTGAATFIADTLNIPIASGGTPAGITGQIQFNNAGSFGADSSLFWDNTNKRLGIGATPSTTVRLDVRAQGTDSTDIAFRVRNFGDTDNIISSYGNELTIIGRNQSTEPRLLINRAGSTKMVLAGTTDLNITFSSSGYGQINTGAQGLDIIASTGDIRTRNSSTFTLLKGNFFGIGQATPQARLDVIAQGALSTDIAFRVRNSADTANIFQVNGMGNAWSNGGGFIASNTAYGQGALNVNTSGSGNTAFGANASLANTTGLNNVSFGFEALRNNVTGSYNVSIGYNSLKDATGIGYNTAIGVGTGVGISSGYGNTLLGYGAGAGITTGNNNTVIGVNIATLASSTTNNVILADGGGNIALRKDANHFVGIGYSATATLAARLDVRAQGALSTDIAFRVRNSADTGDIISQRGNGQLVFSNVTSTYVLNPRTDADGFSLTSGNGAYGTGNGLEVIGSSYFVRSGVRSFEFAGTSISERFVLKNESGDLIIFHGSEQRFSFRKTNFVIGGNIESPTSGATKILAMYTGIAPSVSAVDGIQMYSKDIVAGNAAPHFRTENGGIIKLYQETTAITASTLVSNLGTPLTDTDTFDGYTLKQIVKALRNQGLLT